jgi:DNA-binding PadR family transcriptional regulator
MAHNRSDEPDPQSFLPLSPVALEILMALAGGNLHGYALMREIEESTAGEVKLHPGTLYRALSRLLSGGLVQEIDEPPDPKSSDARRRYYRLTALGRRVAIAEAERLQRQLASARAKKLLRGRSL